MLYHVLSFLDLVVAGIMVAGHFGLLHAALLYAALYLLAKLIFWHDAFSIIDAIVAIYLFFIFFGHASALTWVFLLYFVYKGSVWLFTSLSN